MAIAFRADAETTNSTAGTSCVINKPTGTLDDDALIAVVVIAGTGTITPPNGWTLVTTESVSSGDGIRVSVYWKVASSEGSNYTFTFLSARNVGWIGAFSGADTTFPVSDFTAFSYSTPSSPYVISTPVSLPVDAAGIGIAAAVTGGSSLTWATSGTERADLSTSNVSGSEVSVAISTGTNAGSTPANFSPLFQASETLTVGAIGINIALGGQFTAYDGEQVGAIVQAAFGENPDDATPSLSWSFTDISDDVLENSKVVITKGRNDEQGNASPSTIRFSLLNTDGKYTPGNASGANYPNIKRSVPILVEVPYGYGGSTERALAFVESWSPRWDTSLNLPVVDLYCVGRLSRLGKGDTLQSLMRRSIAGVNSSVSDASPWEYWPMEDGSDADQASSVFVDHKPLRGNANVQFASDDSLLGSAPLPTLSTGGKLTGPIKAYTNTGEWSVIMAFKLDTPVGQRTSLLDIYTNGTVRRWQIALGPGSPDTLAVIGKTVNSSGDFTNTLDDSVSIDENEFYGKWVLLFLCVDQVGSNIDYRVGFYNGSAGNSKSGTLNSQTHGVGQTVLIDGVATLDGASVGHLAFYTSSDFDQANDPEFIAQAGLDGQNGEGPATRLLRLAIEEGVPFSLENSGEGETMNMGPQPFATLADIFKEVESADQGLIHDGGTLGALVFNTRAYRYNAPVAMTLDVDSGELAPGFEPTYDTQQLRNDSTVTRSGGSSARYIGDTSEGVFKDAITLNLEDDTHLYALAGWRVHVGNTPGMRYPRISFDLRRNPHLAQTWLFTPIGSRIRVTGLPPEHGASEVDLFIEGYTETISDFEWKVELNCSPARPYDVATVETPTTTGLRLESSGTTLAGAENTTDTTISVNVTGALWTTTDVPFDIDVDGEQITVTAVSGASSPQTFTVTRSVNGVVKSHSSGASVQLWRPRPLGL